MVAMVLQVTPVLPKTSIGRSMERRKNGKNSWICYLCQKLRWEGSKQIK